MKSSIISNIILGFSLVCTALTLHAESPTNTDIPTANNAQNSVLPLLVDSIDVVDTRNIILRFNQDIIEESIRVRIMKQEWEENVRISSFTGTENENAINIILSDALESNAAYKLTIISAISDEWVIIQDGADGIKEFTTAEILTKPEWDIELNAPSNPNAISIDTSEIQISSNTWDLSTAPESITVVEPIAQGLTPKKAEELPLTGIDSKIFIIIAWIIWLILVFRRRQV